MTLGPWPHNSRGDIRDHVDIRTVVSLNGIRTMGKLGSWLHYVCGDIGVVAT